MSILFLILLLPIAVYGAMMLFTAIAVIKNQSKNELYETNGISILIPCRNEELNIAECLRAIGLNDYPRDKFEVIVIDDHSEDNTIQKAKQFEDNFDLRVLASGSSGKKQALLFGIQTARFPVILTCDADCIPGKEWIKTMYSVYRNYKAEMVCGPIQMQSGSNLFEALQKAESAAIVAISSAFLNAGLPATCNGANLMFSKSTFLELGGYGSHLHMSSGDDDLLMQKFFKHNPRGIQYTLSREAMVISNTSKSFREFADQRLRWLSKRKAYIYPWNTLIQTTAVLHLASFYMLLLLFAMSGSMICLLPVFFKITVDLITALAIKRQIDFNPMLVFLMPFYQLYILILLPVSLFKVPVWKGRVIDKDAV